MQGVGKARIRMTHCSVYSCEHVSFFMCSLRSSLKWRENKEHFPSTFFLFHFLPPTLFFRHLEVFHPLSLSAVQLACQKNFAIETLKTEERSSFYSHLVKMALLHHIKGGKWCSNGCEGEDEKCDGISRVHIVRTCCCQLPDSFCISLHSRIDTSPACFKNCSSGRRVAR